MGRRISLLLTWLSVALITALLPIASFAEPAPPPVVHYSPSGLTPPPGLVNPPARVTAMIEIGDAATAPGFNDPSAWIGTQALLLQSLPALDARVLFQTRLAYRGVAVSAPADQIGRLRALPGVTRVAVIPPKTPSSVVTTSLAGAAATVGALASATGRGVRIGVIDRGIDYTHADFGGPGTPGAYAANNPTIIDPGSFPTAKVAGGYDFAGDSYDASSADPAAAPHPDPNPLECNRPLIGGAPNASNGQGTHVAGLAAGAGVAADGTTYPGPYGPGVDYSGLKIAPGVAPEAQLYALKIFGCQGSTTLLTQAIDYAIDPNGDGYSSDHLDVLLISLSTPFGGPDDPDAIAVDNAVRAGIVVVVAVGESVNTFYSAGSPASAQQAIAVGASDGAGVAAFSARGPQRGNGALKPDLVAPGVNLSSAALATGFEPSVRTGVAEAAPQVAGAAALLRELHATWTPAQIKAALVNSATPVQAPPSFAGAGQLNLAGAEAAELLASDSGTGGGLSYGAPWVAQATTLTRTLRIENTGSADRLVALSATAVATETGVTVTLPPGPIAVPAHGVAQATVGLAIDPSKLDFTPDAATQLIQGDIARHYLAEHGGAIQVAGVSGANGTRARAAHAAHFASVDFYLDNQLLHLSLDSREVKEYVNTTPGPHTVYIRADRSSPSSPPIFSAPVNLLPDRDFTLILVGRPGALGIVVVDETAPAPPPAGQALIHFVNANRTDQSWNIGPLDVYLDGLLQVPALPVGATSAYLPLAPGAHEVSFFHAGANPARDRAVARKSFVAAAGEAILAGTGRHDDDDTDLTDDEQRAFIGRDVARGSSVLLASIPFNVFPTAASDAHANGFLGLVPGARAFELGLRNTGARNTGLVGANATAWTPLASAFELAAESPSIVGLSPSLRGADLQYVGVTSSYSVTGDLSQTLLYFGLSSYGPWSTPNEVEFQIYIDADRDGTDDFVLVNSNKGTDTAAAGSPDQRATDVFTNDLFALPIDPARRTPFVYWGTFTAPTDPPGVNMAPFNSAVAFETASVASLALPLNPAPTGPPPASFCYHVETRSRDAGLFGQVVDRVPATGAPPVTGCGARSGVLFYDVTGYSVAPINTSNFIFGTPTSARPIFLDVDGGQITGGVNPVLLASRGHVKMLILHHHNTPYPQAEVVDFAMPVEAQRPLGNQPRAFVPLALH